MNNLFFIPIGSYEQHGPHLPLEVDYLIAKRISQELSAFFKGTLLEGIQVGISPEHKDFMRTRSITPKEFEVQLNEILNSTQKDSKCVLINAHGGNTETLNSIFPSKNEDIIIINIFSLIKDELLKLRTTKIGGICHAGEFETSLMLYLYPDMVNMDYIQKEDVVYVSEMDPNYVGERIENWKTIDFNKRGILGDPFHATFNKGKTWFNAIINKFEFLIKDFLV